MAARIVALVNRYDNLCNPHLLARAMTPHESLSLLFAQGRSKYDTSILGAFIKMMGVYPPGSTGAAHRRPLRARRRRQLDPAAQAERARSRPGDAARRRAGPRTSRPRPASASGAASARSRLPPTALDYLAPTHARDLLLRAVERGRRGRVNNPLPVDLFNVADAARRTWPALIEAMLEAVCLVEPAGPRIVAANGAAGRLLGMEPAELVGRDMLATAPTPEDEAFWQQVGDKGRATHILSDSFVTRAGGEAVPVVRRVTPDRAGARQCALRRRALRPQRADARRGGRRGDHRRARGDARVDRRRCPRRRPRRPYQPLQSPLLGALGASRGDAVVARRRRGVRLDAPARRESGAYMRRLAEIDDDAMLRATDTIRLRSGAVVERVTLPQLSRGRPIGRVFSFRVVSAGAS